MTIAELRTWFKEQFPTTGEFLGTFEREESPEVLLRSLVLFEHRIIAAREALTTLCAKSPSFNKVSSETARELQELTFVIVNFLTKLEEYTAIRIEYTLILYAVRYGQLSPREQANKIDAFKEKMDRMESGAGEFLGETTAVVKRIKQLLNQPEE